MDILFRIRMKNWESIEESIEEGIEESIEESVARGVMQSTESYSLCLVSNLLTRISL